MKSPFKRNHLVAFLLVLMMGGIQLEAKAPVNAEELQEKLVTILKDAHHAEKATELELVLTALKTSFMHFLDENNPKAKNKRIEDIEIALEALKKFHKKIENDSHKKVRAVTKDLHKVIKDMTKVIEKLRGLTTATTTQLLALKVALDECEYLVPAEVHGYSEKLLVAKIKAAISR